MLRDLVPLIIRIDQRLTSELPLLATKAELAAAFGTLQTETAKLPTRGYLWGSWRQRSGPTPPPWLRSPCCWPFCRCCDCTNTTQAGPGWRGRLAAGFAAVILAAPAARAAEQQRPPYSCRQLYEEQKKCGFGSCDARVTERLKRECLRDGGRP